MKHGGLLRLPRPLAPVWLDGPQWKPWPLRVLFQHGLWTLPRVLRRGGDVSPKDAVPTFCCGAASAEHPKPLH